MFDFVTTDLNILFALSLGGLCLCLILNLRQLTSIIIILTPFQFIETRFGSNSIFLILTVGVVYLFRRQLTLRFTKAFVPLLVAYVISMIFANNGTLVLNAAVLLAIVSCWFLFEISYGFAITDSEKTIKNTLYALNILILLYCGLQLIAGTDKPISFFGIDSLTLHSNRGEGDARLIGPFGTPATTAGYFSLMNILVMGLYQTSRIARPMGLLLIGLNFAMLFATGSRGALIACCVGMFAVASLIVDGRRPFFLQILSFSALILVMTAVSSLVIQKSEFSVMTERLANVFETVDNLPATRAKVWQDAFERIRADPWTGEGPYYVSYDAAEPLGRLKTLYDDYPHSLALFVLRTTGILGLLAATWLFSCLIRDAMLALPRTPQKRTGNVYATLFLIAMLVFLVDQLRIEFIRPSTMDYAHFVFLFFGLILGISKEKVLTDGMSMRS